MSVYDMITGGQNNLPLCSMPFPKPIAYTDATAAQAFAAALGNLGPMVGFPSVKIRST